MPIKLPQTGDLPINVGATALRVSLGVAQQQANALGALAAPIGAVGDALFDASIRIQEASNLKNISEAELTFDERSAEFLQTLDGSFEEDQWVPGATEMVAGVREEISGLNLSPSATRRLDNKLNRKEASFLMRVGSMAATQVMDRARESSLLAAEMAVDAGDLPGYEEKVGEMLEAGVISPEQGDRMMHEGGQKIRKSQLQNLAFADPEAAKAEIEDGQWDDVDVSARASASYRATVEENRMRREFFNELSLALEEGKMPTPNQIDTWKQAGSISTGQAADILKRVNAKTPQEFDSTKYLGLMKDIQNYDPSQDDEAQKDLTDLTSKVMTSGFTGTNLTKLKSNLNGVIEGKSKTPSGRVRTSMMDVLDYYSDQGTFGLERDIDGKVIPESEKLSADKEAALIDELDAWIESNPDATHKEAREAADSIIKPSIEVAGAATLLDVTGFEALQKADSVTTDDLPQVQPLESDLSNNPLLPTLPSE